MKLYRLPKLLFVISLVIGILPACDDEKCGECFTPPNIFIFDLVDQTTNENVFTSGRFTFGDIEILDASDKQVEFSFIEENDVNLIQIHTIGWKTEIVNYRINIGTKNVFDLYVDAERLSEDCCSFTKYKEIEISNTDYTLDTKSDIYTIVVE